ncbi:hypothetical protein [Devosia sp.]|uniref:hypothetical protein n=1 Tax=Devosia sp. TaxID=1871048 RepID=UPI001AC889CB|nr:hypothetical protein [Devosia sp.]MBN9334832.1 hypothetical protein [Devosia sp.]
MIQDFDEIKRQLSELSEVINKFNSEAVQLRIVELIFGIDQSDADKSVPPPEAPPKTRGRKKRISKPSKGETTGAAETGTTTQRGRKSGGSAKGAVSILNDLVEGDFFKSNRTINDIVSYCDQSLARRFKASAFSGALARLTRSGALERQKNADGQYEYLKK